MARATAPGPAPQKGWIGRPRLLVPDPSGFPYRQTVRVATGGVDRTAQIVREALLSQGFAIVGSSPASVAPTGVPSMIPPTRTYIVGERHVEHDVTERPVLIAFWTLVVAGVLLGAIDAVLDGVWQIVVPWVAAFSTIGVVFWYAYGRCYRSDVVMVVIDGAQRSSGDVAGPTSHSVTWLAGRVRSQIRTAPEPHSRLSVRVDTSVTMVKVLAALVQTFGQRVGAPARS